MKLITDPQKLLRRKRKTKRNRLEDNELYISLRRMILDGKFYPAQEMQLSFDPEDKKKLGMKWPWRTAADRLKKMLHEHNLEAEYEIQKFETDSEGTWAVKVIYTPLEAVTKAPKAPPPEVAPPEVITKARRRRA